MLRDPGNVMAGFVLAQIDAAISLFASLLQHGARTPPRRYKRNLQWLLELRTRALSKTSKVSTTHEQGGPQRDADQDRQSNHGGGDGHREQDEDVELLGWRTRLIERAGQGRKKTIRTIPLAETPDRLSDHRHCDAQRFTPCGDTRLHERHCKMGFYSNDAQGCHINYC